MQSSLSFRLMTMEFQIRSWFFPPDKILQQVGVQPTMQVMDFGCGPGFYAIAAARLVGRQGKVFALDIHSLAFSRMRRLIKKEQHDNIVLLHSQAITEIDSGCVDRILLFDTLHHLADPQEILQHMHRVLKGEGLLVIKDHKFSVSRIQEMIQANGLYSHTTNAGEYLLFKKEKTSS